MSDSIPTADEPSVSTPLDIKPGDVVVLYLAHPIRYSDGKGGDELQYMARIQVDDIGTIGISGRGADHPGSIVPTKDGTGERLGGMANEKPDFFPWSTIQRMSLTHRFAEYEALWDAAPE